MWLRYSVVPLLIILGAATTPAGIFKKGSPKPDPEKYVPELIAILKGDKDDGKRLEAVSELRQFDLKTFPDILPALIEALQNDPSTSVRVEAVNALSKVRPITQQIGYALEQALANDSTVRVRVAARTTLWQFHLLGYRSGKPAESENNQSKEPPLAAPRTSEPMKKSTTILPKIEPQPSPAVVTPVTPKVQPPLLNAAPQIPEKKTPIATPVVPPQQSNEPPLATPIATKSEPKPTPKLNLPANPPSLLDPPPRLEKIAPTVPVSRPKPEEKEKPKKEEQQEGPLLSPPKN
jgi:hypothetical protein